jgi:MFS transporter, SP family, general alpha glucoside:H+ symporter
MWVAPLFILISFAPESPWLLVRKGNFDKAKESLLRLTSPDKQTDFDVDETLSVSSHHHTQKASTNHDSSQVDASYDSNGASNH